MKRLSVLRRALSTNTLVKDYTGHGVRKRSPEALQMLNSAVSEILGTHGGQKVSEDVLRSASQANPNCMISLVLEGMFGSDASSALSQINAQLAASSSSSSSSRERAFAAALFLSMAGEHQRAGNVLEHELLQSPADLLAARLAQENYLRAGDGRQALSCVRRTLHLYERKEDFAPFAHPLHYLMAQGYTQAGHLEEAQEMLDSTYSNYETMACPSLSLMLRLSLQHGEGKWALDEYRSNQDEYEAEFTPHQLLEIRTLAALLDVQHSAQHPGGRAGCVMTALDELESIVGELARVSRTDRPSAMLYIDAVCLAWKIFLVVHHVEGALHGEEAGSALEARLGHCSASLRAALKSALTARQTATVCPSELKRLHLADAFAKRLGSDYTWVQWREELDMFMSSSSSSSSADAGGGIMGWLFGGEKKVSTPSTPREQKRQEWDEQGTTGMDGHAAQDRSSFASPSSTTPAAGAVNAATYPQLFELVSHLSPHGDGHKDVREEGQAEALSRVVSAPCMTRTSEGVRWLRIRFQEAGCVRDQTSLLELVIVHSLMQGGRGREARTVLLEAATGCVTHASSPLILAMTARACQRNTARYATAALQQMWEIEQQEV